MRRQVGKLMRTCHGPCGGHRAVPPRKSDAFRQQKLPKAKHQNPQAGRTRAREHAFRSQRSTLQTAKTKAFPPDAGKKTLAKGQKKARGRRTSGEQVPRRGGRDQATCELDAVPQPPHLRGARHRRHWEAGAIRRTTRYCSLSFALSFSNPSHGSRGANGAPPPPPRDATVKI